jgi:hypothetical protein
MMAEGAFDEAVKGVDAVVHMANVMTFSDVYDEVVPVVVSCSPPLGSERSAPAGRRCH